MFNLLRIIGCVFLIIGTTSQLQCGLPGRPHNGTMNIALDSSRAVAKYECPGSFIIDGDVERTCSEDGTWTGTIPRCATEATVRKSLGRNSLTDGILETCDWIHEGNAVELEFQNMSRMLRINIIYSAPYKDLLKEAEFDVQILDRDRVTGTGVNKTFHESDPNFGSNDFSSVQWRLNGSGDAVRVGLVKGNAFLCEIKVFAYPGECGTLDAIHNGHVEYDNTSALCRCDINYQVDGHSSVRQCSDGQWSGEQCACGSNSELETALARFPSSLLRPISWLSITLLAVTLLIGAMAVFLRVRRNSTKKPANYSNTGEDENQRINLHDA